MRATSNDPDRQITFAGVTINLYAEFGTGQVTAAKLKFADGSQEPVHEEDRLSVLLALVGSPEGYFVGARPTTGTIPDGSAGVNAGTVDAPQTPDAGGESPSGTSGNVG